MPKGQSAGKTRDKTKNSKSDFPAATKNIEAKEEKRGKIENDPP